MYFFFSVCSSYNGAGRGKMGWKWINKSFCTAESNKKGDLGFDAKSIKESGGHYAQWNKPVTTWQIMHDSTDIRYLKVKLMETE